MKFITITVNSRSALLNAAHIVSVASTTIMQTDDTGNQQYPMPVYRITMVTGEKFTISVDQGERVWALLS